MNVLFFRVENVLNFPETEAKAPDGRLGVVDKLVRKLSENLKQMEPGTQLVLYGDWTKEWNKDAAACTETGKYLNRKLDRRGLHIMDKAEGENAIFDFVARKHVDEYKVLVAADQ